MYFVPALVILECFFNLSQGFAFDDVVDAVVSQVGDGGGKLSSFVDGVFVDADHEGCGVVEGFFDFEMESFVDDAFDSAW